MLWQLVLEKHNTATPESPERSLLATSNKVLTLMDQLHHEHWSEQSATSEGSALHWFNSDIHRAVRTEKKEKALLGAVQVNCWQNYWFHTWNSLQEALLVADPHSGEAQRQKLLLVTSPKISTYKSHLNIVIFLFFLLIEAVFFI